MIPKPPIKSNFVYCENMCFYKIICEEDYIEYWKSYKDYRKSIRNVKIGKKYQVVHTATPVGKLTIKDDLGWTVTLPKSFFMDEVAYLRQQKINKILDGK